MRRWYAAVLLLLGLHVHQCAGEKGKQVPLVVVVEGWRWVSHSYAVVNSQHLVAMRRVLRDSNASHIKLYTRDVPFVMTGERTAPSDKWALELQQIPLLPPSVHPDVVIRHHVPWDTMPADPWWRGSMEEAKPTALVLVATTETGIVPRAANAGNVRTPYGVCWWVDVVALIVVLQVPLPASAVDMVVTPSKWSAQGFTTAGFPASRIHVIPHGVDTTWFFPVALKKRMHLRRELGWGNEVVILFVGAITKQKGVPLLLDAFCQLCNGTTCHDHNGGRVRLVLKGNEKLYHGESLMSRLLADHAHHLAGPVEVKADVM